jgi:thiamine transport system substrate-binding protein
MLKYLVSILVLVAAPAAAADKPVLTVATYESFSSEWGPGPVLEKAFEESCGCDLVFANSEDGAALLAKLKLDGDKSKADIVLGLDDSLIAEAAATGLIAEHGQDLAGLSLPVAWSDKLFVPFDWGYFAFVYKDGIKALPTSMKELVEMKDGPTIIIQDPRTSTPGLGLVVWMDQVYGDKAGEAWAALKPRIVTVTKGWSEAYGLFLKGEADMVLSYSTSPAYHISAEKRTDIKAAAFAEGHPLQIEVAGILKASQQQDLARSFLAFLMSEKAQGVLPETNWMYPARTPPAGLPESFKGLAVPTKAFTADPVAIAAKRRDLIDTWLKALGQ